MSEPSVYNVQPVVSFSGRPSFKVKANSPEQAKQFVEAKLTEFPSDFAEEAFQQVRNEQLNGGFSAQLGDHVEVEDWGPVSDARDPSAFPDATGFEPSTKDQSDTLVYTVVGTSVHHPGGFIRRVEAGSADEAREIVDDGDETILAVFEGDHDNL